MNNNGLENNDEKETKRRREPAADYGISIPAATGLQRHYPREV